MDNIGDYWFKVPEIPKFCSQKVLDLFMNDLKLKKLFL